MINWALMTISSIIGIACSVGKYSIYERGLPTDTLENLLIGIDIIKDIAFIYIVLYYLLSKI